MEAETRVYMKTAFILTKTLHNGTEEPEVINLVHVTRMYHVKTHEKGVTTLSFVDGSTVTVSVDEASRIYAAMSVLQQED